MEQRGSRSMELLEGKMDRTLNLLEISTKSQQIAKLAKENPARVFTSLAHLIDINWLQEAYERTRKDGATGIDGQTATEYAENLEGNLQFFDTLNHAQLREFLAIRMRDGVLTRLIGKWLNAGVMEAGAVTRTELGTPQGGVISPLLANIYLHYVLDQWFAQEVQPRLKGAAKLVRYADDAVIVCSYAEDAERLMAVLPKRFARFGLTLHPDKTRLVRFERPPLYPAKTRDDSGGTKGPESFDFLGFTFYWGRSRKGFWVVWRKTAKDRLSRAIKRIDDWCRENRHKQLGEQHKTLCQKIKGHYGYYGVTGNMRSMGNFVHQVKGKWQYWLGRRSGHARQDWQWFYELQKRLPLPNPYIAHAAVF